MIDDVVGGSFNWLMSNRPCSRDYGVSFCFRCVGNERGDGDGTASEVLENGEVGGDSLTLMASGEEERESLGI